MHAKIPHVLWSSTLILRDFLENGDLFRIKLMGTTIKEVTIFCQKYFSASSHR